ncbi:MAG: MFS transporter, partial [Methyloceanibacter sp.]
MTRTASATRRRPGKTAIAAISEIAEDAAKRPSVALVVAVVLTAILEVLDITIVSVAIPHMIGTFGVTSDQITWVLTSYLVSAAVVMPLTGYLSARLGRRRLLTLSIMGFVVSSALCGVSWNLESMVIFRLAQGISG